MKFLNQLEYGNIPYITMTELSEEEKQVGKTTTIKNAGCGLCSAVMVADRLIPNTTFSLNDAINLSYEVKANTKRGTQYKIFAPIFAKKLGLKLEMTDDIKRVSYALKTGGVVVANVCGDYENHVGVFSHGGHYVTVINLEEDGKVAVLDPSIKDGKYDEDGRKGKVEVKGEIALCSLKTLEKDCKMRTPAFYLFWRE